MHTPGPWNVKDEIIRTTIVASDGKAVAMALLPKRGVDEARANAVLIATAPELLEILKDLLTDYEHTCDVLGPLEGLYESPEQEALFARVRAVIAKAIVDSEAEQRIAQ